MRRWIRYLGPVGILLAALALALPHLNTPPQAAPSQVTADSGNLDWQSESPSRGDDRPVSEIPPLFTDHHAASPLVADVRGLITGDEPPFQPPPRIDDHYVTRLPFRIAESQHPDELLPVQPKPVNSAPPRPVDWIEHEVRAGETLQSIATHYFGRPDRYLEIYQLNRQVLSTPAALPEGVTIRIPGS